MKKLILAITLIGSIVTFAGPHGCPPPPPHGPHPGPHHPCPPPPHHDSFWGSVAGSAIGTFVGNLFRPREAVVVQQPTTVVQQTPVVVQQPVVQQTTTTVVTQPVVQPQQVWVEGRYVDQVNANGTVTRVWVAGHYETR